MKLPFQQVISGVFWLGLYLALDALLLLAVLYFAVMRMA
jgi:hypothetical protein